MSSPETHDRRGLLNFRTHSSNTLTPTECLNSCTAPFQLFPVNCLQFDKALGNHTSVHAMYVAYVCFPDV